MFALIVLSVIITLYLYTKLPDYQFTESLDRALNPDNSMIDTDYFGTKKFDLKLLPSDSLEKNLKSALSYSFNNYYVSCKDFDEIKPISGECTNINGFSATIIESLESLYLLGLKKEYKNAVKYLLNNDKPIGKVNRRDFFTKYIGSLIGASLLTGDESLLSLANKYALKIIKIDSTNKLPKAFINFHSMKSSEHVWENGTSIADIVAGIPEMLALYKLTKEKKYVHHVESILKVIKDKSYIFYNSSSGQNQSDVHIQSNLFDDYSSILSLGYSIHPMGILSEVLKNPIDLTKKNKGLRKYDEIKPKDNQRPYQFDKNITQNAFNFKSAFLRKLFNDSKENDQEMESLINESLFVLNAQYGYHSIISSSSGRVFNEDRQPSSFISEWISLGGHLVRNYSLESRKKLIFNERGHLLSKPEK